jgi:hypothetical protein
MTTTPDDDIPELHIGAVSITVPTLVSSRISTVSCSG